MPATPNYGLQTQLPIREPMSAKDSLSMILQAYKAPKENALLEQQVQRNSLLQPFIEKEAELGLQKGQAETQQVQAQTKAVNTKNQQEQWGMINKLTGAVKFSPENLKPEVYKKALQIAGAMGVDVSSLPQNYSPEAQSFIDKTFLESGDALTLEKMKVEEAQVKATEAGLPLEQVYDEQGKRIFVPKQEAVGKTPVNPYELSAQADIQKAKINNQNQALQKFEEESSTAAVQASEALEILNNMEELLPKIPLGTGPVVGKAAQFTTAGGLFEKDSQRLLQMALKNSAFKSRVTNAEMMAMQKTFPNDKLTISANRQLISQIRSIYTRDSQYPAFVQLMQSKGVTTPQEIQAKWSEIINQNPIINDKGEFMPKNATAWSKYVFKDAADFKAWAKDNAELAEQIVENE